MKEELTYSPEQWATGPLSPVYEFEQVLPAPDVVPPVKVQEPLQTTGLNDTTAGVESVGEIYDEKTGELVLSRVIWWNVATKEVYSDKMVTGFHVWANYDIENVQLEISAKGFKTVKLMASELQPVNDIYLQRAGNYSVLAIAALAGLILFASKRKKKVGAVAPADVTPFLLIAGGILAFDLVKKTLEALGIWESQDTKDLDNASGDPNSFWSPNYWQTVKPANAAWTYALTEQQALQYCNEIEDAFTWYNDCEECVIAIFKRCRTKANASFICWVFQKYKGQDLLTYLRGGIWPQDRLSDSDVSTINQFISNLPKY